MNSTYRSVPPAKRIGRPSLAAVVALGLGLTPGMHWLAAILCALTVWLVVWLTGFLLR